MPVDRRQQLARTGERLAAEHLERLGFTILERNFRTRWGELDLIAVDEQRIVFCEVKTRCGRPPPVDAVGPGKQRRVRRMASQWLCGPAPRPRAAELRFDAIAISVDAHGRLAGLEHLEGAF